MSLVDAASTTMLSLPGIVQKYLRFCLVGGSGVVVDMFALFLFGSPDVLGWNLTLSKILAAELAIANNFLWNDAWTFRKEREVGDRSMCIRFARFNLICCLGIGISVLLLNVLVHSFHWNIYLANLSAIVITSVWNFWLNYKLAWTTASRTNRIAPTVSTRQD